MNESPSMELLAGPSTPRAGPDKPSPRVGSSDSTTSEKASRDGTGDEAERWFRLLSRRLGAFAGTVIVLGGILELGTLGLLAFLWVGRGADSDGSDASSFWRLITLQGWSTRVVTLAALVLRTVVDMQGTISTGLVAALMLEAGQVPLSMAGRFSILRAINGGPFTLAQPMMTGMHFRSFYSVPAAMILITYVASMAAHFSSTLLLGDFRQTSILSEPMFNSTPVVGLRQELALPSAGEPVPGFIIAAGSSVWAQGLSDYPTFGEDVAYSALTGPNITDTGFVKRALVPFQSKDRLALRRFDGPAVTLESRTACVRPTLTGRLTVNASTARISWKIIGNMSWDFGDPYLNTISCGNATGCALAAVNCGMPSIPSASGDATPSSLDHTPTNLCSLSATGPSLPFRNNSYTFAIFNTTASQRDLNSTLPVTLPTATPFNEWKSFSLVTPTSNNIWQLNATVCVTSLAYDLEDVILDSTKDTNEPEITYNATSGVWEMDPILNLVGFGPAGKSPTSDRGILTITSASPVSNSSLSAMAAASRDYRDQPGVSVQDRIDAAFNNMLLALGSTGLNGAFNFYFCTDCPLDGNNYTIPHPYYVLLFHAILEHPAGGPAAAAQTVLFWLAQNRYYAALPGFSFGGNATTAWAVQISVPGAWGGFAATAAILVLNLACLGVIGALFLRRTRWSSYGNVWQALAQVRSPETRPILERAGGMTDSEVARSLEERGADWGRAGLGYVGRPGRGNVAIVRRLKSREGATEA